MSDALPPTLSLHQMHENWPEKCLTQVSAAWPLQAGGTLALDAAHASRAIACTACRAALAHTEHGMCLPSPRKNADGVAHVRAARPRKGARCNRAFARI